MCIILAWFSWNQFQKGETRYAIALLVIVAVILRCFVSMDPFLHAWDERYHALVAKNLMQHPLSPTLYDHPILSYDYKIWSGNHIWLHKQPLTLWGMSWSMKIFGVNEYAVRIPSIILSSISVVVIYAIGKRLFSKEAGFYAAFLFAINGWVLELVAGRASTDHVDIYFTCFILFAVYFAVLFSENRKTGWNVLCGVAIGLAVLCKWLPALIVLPIWLSLVWNHRFSLKQVLLQGATLIGVVALVALPWQLYIYSAFPLEAAWEDAYNMKHFFEGLEGHVHPFYYHFEIMRISYGELIYLPLIWFIYRAFKLKTNGSYWAMLIWVVIPFVFFSISATKMQAYTMFAAPALFLITGVFAHYLIVHRDSFKYKRLSMLVVIALFALPIRYSFERIAPLQQIAEEPNWQKNISAFNDKTKGQKKIIVFNTPYSIEYMFHTDATAYGYLPAKHVQDSLQKLGYQLYLVDENEVPRRIESSNGSKEK